MRTNLLITVAAAALLAGTALASAQGARQGNDLPGGRAPSAAPAEKIEQNAPATRTQVDEPKSDQKATQDRNAQTPSRSTTGQAPDRRDSQMGQGQSGQGQSGRDQNQQPRTGQTQQPAAKGETQQPAAKSQTQQPATQTQTQQKSGSDQNRQQTGQSDKGGSATSASLSTEQRTKIRESVIKQSNAPRVSRTEINFNISVGTAVPRSVRLVTVPTTVVEIYPAWSGFLYFLVGDEIIIVEPGSMHIVAVIPA